MAGRAIFALLAAGLAGASPAAGQIVLSEPALFAVEPVIDLPGPLPVGLTFAPDGAMFVWTKDGQVRVVRDGALLPAPFVDLAPRVNHVQDRGLLGFALAPDSAASRVAYLLYTYEDGDPPNPNDGGPKTARLSRILADPANPDVALPGSEVAILGTVSTPPCNAQPPAADCMPSDSDSHTIGTVRIAPDGSLFVGNGDGAWYTHVDPNALRAQSLDRLAGKILRILPSGAGHPGNPFYQPGQPNAIRSKVWAYGLRNPFRFALDPWLGEPWIGDVGWNDWEELDRGRGANFGWPCFEGAGRQLGYDPLAACQALDEQDVTPPAYAYEHGEGFAVVAAAFYGDGPFPPSHRGSLYLADYVSGWIRRARFLNGNLVDVVPFATGAPGPVAIEQGPDGCLYTVGIFTGEIHRICAIPLFADGFESGDTTAWSASFP
jgi:glucose/arabinose dehydrogenase